ncbi:MAG: GNAT family N-acetyltransferase [Kineosporiaceae bacterium]
MTSSPPPDGLPAGDLEGLVAGLSWRAAHPDDAAAIGALMARAAEVDDPQEHYTAEDVADELAAPWLEPARDSRIGLDGEGVPRAFATLELRPGDVDLLRPNGLGVVDPQVRRRGVGTALLGWQLWRSEQKVRERRAALGTQAPARFLVFQEPGNDGVAHLARRFGLEVLRYFLVMRRPLDGDLPPVRLPDGVVLRDYDAEPDAVPLLHAHNTAFADHWGFQPWTEETWRQWEVDHRDFRADWTLSAVDEAGGDVLVGYATAAGYTADWEATGVREGWTSKVGVLPAHRGRGIATALLAAQLHRFAVSGMDVAGLDVDAENPAGALSLYQRLGYAEVRRNVAWGRWL